MATDILTFLLDVLTIPGFTGDIADSAGNIESNLSGLQANLPSIGSITATSGMVDVDVAALAANQGALGKLASPLGVSDTVSNIVNALPLISADNNIVSVHATDGNVHVAIAPFLADQSGLDRITDGFYVDDTAAHISANLDHLNDPLLLGITVSDSAPVGVSVGQLTSDAAAIGKLGNANLTPTQLAVTDTSAHIVSGLATLQANVGMIGSITPTDGIPVVPVAALQADQAALDKITGGFSVADTAANIEGALPLLGADSHAVAVTSTDGPVVATVATFAADKPGLDKVTGGFTVADTAANIESALPALVADIQVASIVATDKPVVVSVPTFTADQAALDKITGGFTVADTAANIEGALPLLGADSHVVAVTSTDGPVVATVATFAADKPGLDKITGGFTVADTAANIESALPALVADSHVASIVATDKPVVVSVPTFTADQSALDKINGGFAVADAAAAVQAALPQLQADSHITGIAVTDGPVVVSPADYSADQAVLGKISSGVTINGFTPGNPIDLASLGYKSSFEAVYTVDTGALNIIDTAAAGAVVATLDIANSLSGEIVTLGSDGASGTSVGLQPYAPAVLAPGDVVYSALNGSPYGSLINHFASGVFTGTTYDYTTATGQPFIGYASAANGIEGFSVDGSQGLQNIIGALAIDFINTSAAAGTGLVAVDLKNGDVSRGTTLDATLHNIIGVQLGDTASNIAGLASGTDLLYGGAGADGFYGEGGTDYIQGGTGTSTIVGGAGNEIFYSGGGVDTMLGGTLANDMVGGSSASSVDNFYGNGGADYVSGQGGTVNLVGSSGLEALFGGSGTNSMLGGTGTSIFVGGTGSHAGTDVDYAGIGVNLMYEGDGTSAFVGGAGTDFVGGGAGQSFVYLGSGHDFINTGAGNQYVKAGTGSLSFNETAAHLTAGRFDQIDNFQGATDVGGGKGASIYMPTANAGDTSFLAVNGGTAIVSPAVGGTGSAVLFVSNTAVGTVQANTHFTL